uniref:Uncharacterized protein n=1 Tax=Arundo donax TaxID=35708 RepID=A0A0A9D0K4_ARUDO
MYLFTLPPWFSTLTGFFFVHLLLRLDSYPPFFRKANFHIYFKTRYFTAPKLLTFTLKPGTYNSKLLKPGHLTIYCGFSMLVLPH